MRPLSLIEIHNALCTAQRPLLQEQDMDVVNDNSIEHEGSQKILHAVKQGEESSVFHESLHEYSLIARPTTTDDIANLFKHVNKLIQLCDTSRDSWKVFVLTVFLRRYHEKAPEAKKARAEDSEESVGNGERLIFYGTILELHRFWQENQGQEQGQLSYDAAAALVRTASQIGGTRDLCSVIEHLTLANLKRSGIATGDGDAAPESFAEVIVPAVKAIAVDGQSPPDSLLELALRLAAQNLDQDLNLLHSTNDDEGEGRDDFISTIHVKIPHNQRGSNTKTAWKRKLVNSLAEVLIWQRTSIAREDERFCKALGKLKALPSRSPTDNLYKLIQQLQTTARKKRQLLNNYAREQGFMLTSSYQLDKTSLTLSQVRRAKVGDLKLLEKLAKKSSDTRTLMLISKRSMDPIKATSIESIHELSSGWLDIHKDYGDDEIAKLELAMQANTVKATLDKLQRKAQASRPVVVSCAGTDRDNFLCAILVAASLEDSKLILGGSEHDVSSLEKCLDVLNREIIDGKFSMDEPAMSADDIIARISGVSKDVIIMSSADLELDEKDLKDLQARDITIRVHATNKVTSAGEVQLSLNSAIYDRIKRREPFSLSVVLDCTGSMGSEIQGCKKGALELISKFQELAPVAYTEICGYWDPVYVRTDPQPKSTGFLDTADKSTSDTLQEFVNTQLVCQGGGDEPEDIPKALEQILADMKKIGLSAKEGVHMVFFIADAGFRPNENTRVQRALEELKALGTVFVMCSVRGGQSLNTFVDVVKNCFEGAGQYAGIKGVGQLGHIASSVMESIRASLFKSDVVSVTASSGATIDSVRNLVSFQEEHTKLKETAKLAKVESHDEDMITTEVFASKEFALTSRDRLYLQLSRLPEICHVSVGNAFGGKTLKELSAYAIAERLRLEDIPLTEIKKAGYPNDVVDLVQNLLGSFGVKRAVDALHSAAQ